MKREKGKARRIINTLMPLTGVAAAVAVWWIASAVYANPVLFPSPADSLIRALELFPSDDFPLRLMNTFLRGLLSFAVSYICALGCAVICRSTGIFKAVNPVISAVRAVPTITVILLVFLWTGAKITPVIVASLVVFPTLFTMFYSALSGIDKAYVEGVWLEGGGRLSIIRYVYVPFMHTSLIEGAGSGLSLSLKLVVSAEAIAQTALSIGAMMKQASAEFDPATLFATALIITLLCILIEWSIPAIDRKITKGKYEDQV